MVEAWSVDVSVVRASKIGGGFVKREGMPRWAVVAADMSGGVSVGLSWFRGEERVFLGS